MRPETQARRAKLRGNTSYQRLKAVVCKRCGFVPEDLCQLDVDHIDGNSRNHKPDNLQTLCANCHRLKTKQSGEGIYRSKSDAARATLSP